MNCVLLSKTTGLELDSYDIHSASLFTTSIEESYATTPMIAVASPVEHHDNEEELHTSFEQAISGRVSALQGRLSRISESQAVVSSSSTTTAAGPLSQGRDSRAVTTEPLPGVSLPGSLRQQGIVFASLALGFAMLGFDLMGLLVLHMR